MFSGIIAENIVLIYFDPGCRYTCS